MKKNLLKVGLSAIVFSLSLSLAACGGLTEKTVTGTDGVTATASSSWQQIAGDEELGKLFDTDGVDVEDIKLALGKNGGRDGYLIVEEVYPQATMEELKNYYMGYANKPDQLDAAIAEMKSYYLTDREIEQITPIIKGETLTPEQVQYLDQETVLQGYMYNLTKDSALNIKQNAVTDLMINGQKVQFAEYVYSNAQLTKIKQIDGYAQIGERFYLISVWDNENEFEKNRSEYIKVLESIKIQPAVTTVQSPNP